MHRSERKTVLAAFERAFGQELHILREYPQALWQQLYNRLQWADGEGGHEPVARVIAPEFIRRTAPGAKPWLHLKTRLRESSALHLVLKGHMQSVSDCVFSPDGNTLASAGFDHTVRLWDTNTGSCRTVLAGRAKYPELCTFSPDGQTLAAAYDDRIVRLWDVNTGGCTAVLSPPAFRFSWYKRHAVAGLNFSPDGRMLAGVHTCFGLIRHTQVRLWNVRTGAFYTVFRGMAFHGSICRFALNGKTIVVAGHGRRSKTIELRTVRTGFYSRFFSRFKARGTATVRLSGNRLHALSPDGNTVAGGHADETIRLWDAKTGSEKSRLSGHTNGIMCCTFSADGTMLASGSRDNTIRLWDVQTASCRAVLRGHSGTVRRCAFAANGRIVASGSEDGMVRLWRVQEARQSPTIRGHTDRVWCCAFSPDGGTVMSASADKTIRFWNARTGEGTGVLEGDTSADGTIRPSSLRHGSTRPNMACPSGHTGPVQFCAFSPDGRTVASAGSDHTVRLWDLQTGSCRVVVKNEGRRPCFSPDGKTIAVPYLQWLELFDTATGSACSVIEHTAEVISSAFSPDGRTVLVQGSNGEFIFWDCTTRARTGQARLVAGRLCLIPDAPAAFSADGKKLVAVWLHDVYVYDARTWTLERHLGSHDGWVGFCAISPDGTTVVSVERDASHGDAVRLWNADTGRCKVLPGHASDWEMPIALAFSPDGTMLVSANGDRIRLWDARTGALIALYAYPGRLSCCAFSPLNNVIAAGDVGGPVYVLNLVGLDTVFRGRETRPGTEA